MRAHTCMHPCMQTHAQMHVRMRTCPHARTHGRQATQATAGGGGIPYSLHVAVSAVVQPKYIYVYNISSAPPPPTHTHTPVPGPHAVGSKWLGALPWTPELRDEAVMALRDGLLRAEYHMVDLMTVVEVRGWSGPARDTPGTWPKGVAPLLAQATRRHGKHITRCHSLILCRCDPARHGNLPQQQPTQ